MTKAGLSLASESAVESPLMPFSIVLPSTAMISSCLVFWFSMVVLECGRHIKRQTVYLSPCRCPPCGPWRRAGGRAPQTRPAPAARLRTWPPGLFVCLCFWCVYLCVCVFFLLQWGAVFFEGVICFACARHATHAQRFCFAYQAVGGVTHHLPRGVVGDGWRLQAQVLKLLFFWGGGKHKNSVRGRETHTYVYSYIK